MVISQTTEIAKLRNSGRPPHPDSKFGRNRNKRFGNNPRNGNYKRRGARRFNNQRYNNRSNYGSRNKRVDHTEANNQFWENIVRSTPQGSTENRMAAMTVSTRSKSDPAPEDSKKITERPRPEKVVLCFEILHRVVENHMAYGRWRDAAQLILRFLFRTDPVILDNSLVSINHGGGEKVELFMTRRTWLFFNLACCYAQQKGFASAKAVHLLDAYMQNCGEGLPLKNLEDNLKRNESRESNREPVVESLTTSRDQLEQ